MSAKSRTDKNSSRPGDAFNFQSLRKKAIAWFDKHGRELPWRQTSDRYEIWISEIMLQQTQVATVIPYYHRFLQRFPTVVQLADADLDEVYQLWAGLGYYRRARQLHQAAQQVVEQHDGVFPSESAQVLALPGIGRYTGNAILTFADDAKLPIVEANTQRLYSRLLRWKGEITAKESQSALWEFAEAILPKKSGSGQLNQAMMEIGSQLCLPKRPTCLLCPLQTICPTFEHGEQHLIPAPKKPKEFTDLKEAAVVIRDAKGRYLMRRCASDERWAGLWDFPRFDTTQCKGQEAVRSSLSRQFAERFGSPLHIGNELHQLKHAVTRYRITLTGFEAVLDVSERKFSAGKVEILWCNLAQMEKLAMNASCTRLWNWLKKRSEE